ncbi:ARL14 effector protein-like [Hydra vulgaris]|uniref:ARL14 effector protein-like n=1 Tax=Hydra vulgaris TaxID=6087 RepID=UPI0002B471E8|nr:ARL14 effector protein-like [Hydra vulgaris]
MTEKCCVVKLLNEDCDKTYYCRMIGRIKLKDIVSTDAEVLIQRIGHTFEQNEEICFHHEKAYISRYEALQKYCCDPFKVHKKKIIKGLCKVDDLTASQLKIKPGQKLCTNCLNEFKLEQITGKFSQEDEDKDVDDEEFSSSDLNKTVLNKSFFTGNISSKKCK